MGYFPRALAILTLVAAVADTVRAEERLVMPFRCEAHGGGISLVPAEEQSYRIQGLRQTQLFTSCSPDNPDRCRHWRLHKFDVDCGGVRVPWVEVAAAGSTRGGVSVEGRRMSLSTGSTWADRREIPRRRWWRERWNSRYDDSYHGGRGHDPRGASTDVVEFPPGFAPSLGIPMQFEGKPAPPAATAMADPQNAKPPPAPAVKAPAPKPAKKEAAPAPATKDEAKQEKDVPAKLEPPALSDTSKQTVAAGSVSATIINAPQAEQATGQHSTPPASAAAGPPDKAVVEQVSPPQADASPISTGSLREESSTNGAAGVPTPIAGLGAAAVLMALSYFVWSRRSERSQHVRDLGAISLGELRRGRALSVTPHAPGVVARRQRGGAVAAANTPLPATDAAFAVNDIVMPSTVHEALEVIGASPDASPQAIKKIVDGLRQSWHPDLAKSEDDRLLREQRLAQINVAWDILSGRQSAA